MGDFPSGPAVETPYFHCRRHGSNPQSRKFHMPQGAAKKKKRKEYQWDPRSRRKAEGPPRKGRWSGGDHSYAVRTNQVLV